MIKQILCAAILVSLIQAEQTWCSTGEHYGEANVPCKWPMVYSGVEYDGSECVSPGQYGEYGWCGVELSMSNLAYTQWDACLPCTCTMDSYCESCQYTGEETYIGSMTLEECQAACLDDSTCVAIDFGKSGSTSSCFHNFAYTAGSSSTGGYDSWIKSCVDSRDCNGEANGDAVVDECGVCGGDNACVDCNGVANGDAVVDECGVCNGDNACVDCNGVANGGATIDQCGVCGGDDACVDCNGVANGDATIDQCGVCDGDNACVDCNGVANGGAVVDECGECGGDGSSCACMNPVSCKGLGQEECEANPEVCTTVHGKNHFKKCKPTKSLMCKSQGTQELCEELCYCQAKVNKKGVFKKCKDKDPADY